jgi:hypothetical protein
MRAIVTMFDGAALEMKMRKQEAPCREDWRGPRRRPSRRFST